MAAMMNAAAPVCVRASANPSARKARAMSSRAVAPAALRRSAVSAQRRGNSIQVRSLPYARTPTRTFSDGVTRRKPFV